MGKEIVPTDFAKDLGVILDSCLTYNNHIASTVSSCMARLGQINRVKHAFDTTTLTIMINALVFSKLYYCCNVWSNTSEHNLNRIQGVQNFAARIVSGSGKYDHISPILKDLRWLPVRQQLYFRHAIMAFKFMTGCAPDSLFSKYVQRTTITKRTTRNIQMLNIPCSCHATWLPCKTSIIVLMQISRLRFKQSRISMPIPHIYVLGRFVILFGDF